MLPLLLVGKKLEHRFDFRDEHRLRPAVAPKYEKLSREQLVAEIQALGWKAPTETYV